MIEDSYMKKIAAVMLLLLSATAHAHHENPFWYTGVAYSILDTELSSASAKGDSEPGAINITVGHEFNVYFALEGLLGRGLYDDKVANQPVVIELESIAGLSAVGLLPLTKTFTAYGKLGLAKISYEDAKGNDADGNGAMYGLGAAFDISEKIALSVEYMQYPDADYNHSNMDVETSAFNVGFNFKF